MNNEDFSELKNNRGKTDEGVYKLFNGNNRYRSDDEININEIQQKELNKLPKEISLFVESYLKSHNSAPIIVIAE